MDEQVNALQLSSAGGAALPTKAVTDIIAGYGMRGSGKTTLGAVLVEEMHEVGARVVVLDLLGVWWGLRAGATSSSTGLPFVIFGGEHADVPIVGDLPTASKLGNILGSEALSAVVDVSRFASSSARGPWLAALLTAMYEANRQPLQLVLDEADFFAPLRPDRHNAQLGLVVDEVVRRGRVRGFGATLLTQRPAALATNVRSQADTVVALRLSGAHDHDALDDWMRAHGLGAGTRRDVEESLSKLAVGEAWGMSRHWRGAMRFQVRPRRTLDASATPEVGSEARPPPELTGVQVANLVAQLRAEVAPPTPLKAVRVAEPDIAEQICARLRVLLDSDVNLANVLTSLVGLERDLREAFAPGPVPSSGMVVHLLARYERLRKASAERAEALRKLLRAEEDQVPPTPVAPPAVPITPAPPAGPAKPPLRKASAPSGKPSLGARRILFTLFRSAKTLERQELATLAGFTATGGTFTKYMSDLSRASLIITIRNQVGLTEIGKNALLHAPAEEVNLPLTLAGTRRLWRFGGKVDAMVEALVRAGAGGTSREGLAQAVGLERSGGTFTKYLSTLRRAGFLFEQANLVALAPFLRTLPAR